jgi:hypothetical protein
VKVMLETRCGCTRTLDIVRVSEHIYVPLWEDLRPVTEEVDTPVPRRVRRFRYHMSIDNVAWYREVLE